MWARRLHAGVAERAGHERLLAAAAEQAAPQGLAQAAEADVARDIEIGE